MKSQKVKYAPVTVICNLNSIRPHSWDGAGKTFLMLDAREKCPSYWRREAQIVFISPTPTFIASGSRRHFLFADSPRRLMRR